MGSNVVPVLICSWIVLIYQHADLCIHDWMTHSIAVCQALYDIFIADCHHIIWGEARELACFLQCVLTIYM